MDNQAAQTINASARIGALAGAICFFIFGLIPGIYFGSFTMIVLMSKLAGGAVQSGTLQRIMLIVGMGFGLMLSLTVFVVGGAFAGAVLGHINAMLSAGGSKTTEVSSQDKGGDQ